METYHVTESTRALCMRPLLKTGLSSRLIPTPDVARITHILTVLSICRHLTVNKLLRKSKGEKAYATSCDKRELWMKGLENL